MSFAGTYYDPSEMATYSVADSVSGDTFYVDTNSGSDSNNGLSSEAAFKTLSHAFDRYRSNYVIGGDVVKIKAGIYRESLALSFVAGQVASLSSETPLIIGPYGDGEVIVDPSSTPQSWTAHDANIFWAAWSGPYPPWAVVLDDDFKACRDKQALEDLTAYGLWWYDSENEKIYIHTTGTDPTTLDPVITYNYTSAEQYALKLNGYSHIKVYGITFRGAARYGITDYNATPGTNITIEKCTIKHNNGNGVRLFSSYSFLTKNHIYGNMLYCWPRGRIYAGNGGWGQGATISNYGVASGNYSHDNGGEGIGVYGGSGYTEFYDNISANNWSVGLYLDNAPQCYFYRNLVYSSNPDETDIVEEWQLPQWIIDAGAGTISSETTKIIARLRQFAINIGDESATNPTAQGINHRVYNNILIGGREGFGNYGQATGSGLKNYYIVSNTIVMPTVNAAYGKFYGIRVDSNNVNNNGSIIKNNLVIAPVNVTDPLVHSDTGEWVGVSLDNNLYYAVTGTTPFEAGSYPDEVQYNFADWKTQTSQDANSVNADPGVDNSSWSSTRATEILALTGIDITDYIPASAESASVDIGATLGSPYHLDFDGNARGDVYDAGAFEFGSSAPGTLRPTLSGNGLKLSGGNPIALGAE